MAFSRKIQEAWGNRWYALPLLALIGLFSCTGEKSTDVLPTVDLTDVTNRTEIKLSDVTSDVTYVKLETNDSCLIGNNFQLYADDQYIFSFSNGQIYLFDRKDGHFVRAISKRGEGPGEYSRITRQLPVNERERSISAYTGKGLITYSYEGEMISQVNRPENAACFDLVRVAPDLYAGYQFNMPDKLILFDKNGNEVKRVANPKVAETNAFLVPNCGFFEYDNQVNLFESLGDTIYSISPAGDLSARYRLDWGSHQIVIENMSDQVAAKEYCYPQMIGETGDFLFISYIYQTKPALSLYNKRTKQVTHAAEGGTLTNDVDGFAPMTLSSVSNGRLVGYVNAETFLEWSESESGDWASNPKLAPLKATGEMDNPIVVIGQLH